MLSDLGQQVLVAKYAMKDDSGQLVEDSWEAVVERLVDALHEELKFEKSESVALKDMIIDQFFIPGGRILHCVGNRFLPNLSISNCFVVPPPEDSIESIFDRAKQLARIYSWGGGAGIDLSTLRPKGAPVKNSARFSSGAVSFVDFYSYVTNLIGQEGRRGANIQILGCNHPDVLQFISLKDDLKTAQFSNLSVKLFDAFMEALLAEKDWELSFHGNFKTKVPAKDIMSAIVEHSWKTGEPGVLFWDRIVKKNPGSFHKELTPVGVNPCGETNLAAWESCILGSINLSKLIDNPFETGVRLNIDKFAKVTRLAVRFLDYVLEYGLRRKKFPLKQTEKVAKAGRRIGLGVMGYADLLIKSKVSYGSEKAFALTESIARLWVKTAYEASIELAEEHGAFPLYDQTYWDNHPMVKDGGLPTDLKGKPIRNVSVLSIAPTGTISILADCSSGIEPNFEFFYKRRVILDGEPTEVLVQAGIVKEFEKHNSLGQVNDIQQLPQYFVSAIDLAQEGKIYQRVDTQAIWQKYVDASISSTINLNRDFSVSDMTDLYIYAWQKGLKGLTVYRSGSRDGVLTELEETKRKNVMLTKKSNISGTKRDREFKLNGVTYRLQTPLAPHSLYVTLNYQIDEQGIKRPFEMFINSKWVDHFDYMVALTRLISSIFRQSENPMFLLKQLRSVMSPNSGYFKNGRFITSILVEIADIIEKFLVEEIGLDLNHLGSSGKGGDNNEGVKINETQGKVGDKPIMFRTCPVCKELALVREGGCWICKNCGYDKCG